jgi:HK97 family phage prohead protease
MDFHRIACQLKFAPSEDDAAIGTFSGYGAIFGNVDSYGDVIAKGAFKETLRAWKKRGGMPKMLLQHGGGFFGGAEDGIPVGVWDEMSEDDTGLAVKGSLFALDTQKGKYIHEGLKSGALDGLSIGYVPVDVSFGKKPEDPARTLKKVDLYEVSIVTFPANDVARVESVKSIEDVGTLAQAEAWLRDEARLSRSAARALVSRIKSLSLCDEDEALTQAQMARLVDAIKSTTGAMLS